MSLSDSSQLSELYRILSVHPRFRVIRQGEEDAKPFRAGGLIKEARLARFGAEFEGELTLLAFGREQKTSAELVFDFQWYAPRIETGWRVFFHFLNAQEEISFQGDYNMRDAPLDAWGFRYFRRTVDAPRHTPSGDYRMRLGVWLPEEGRHLKLTRHRGCPREAPGWCQNAVLLGSVTVTAS